VAVAVAAVVWLTTPEQLSPVSCRLEGLKKTRTRLAAPVVMSVAAAVAERVVVAVVVA
jgi:hypothetical protein